MCIRDRLIASYLDDLVDRTDRFDGSDSTGRRIGPRLLANRRAADGAGHPLSGPCHGLYPEDMARDVVLRRGQATPSSPFIATRPFSHAGCLADVSMDHRAHLWDCVYWPGTNMVGGRNRGDGTRSVRPPHHGEFASPSRPGLR